MLKRYLVKDLKYEIRCQNFTHMYEILTKIVLKIEALLDIFVALQNLSRSSSIYAKNFIFRRPC